jgi:hypothetical protein
VVGVKRVGKLAVGEKHSLALQAWCNNPSAQRSLHAADPAGALLTSSMSEVTSPRSACTCILAAQGANRTNFFFFVFQTVLLFAVQHYTLVVLPSVAIWG